MERISIRAVGQGGLESRTPFVFFFVGFVAIIISWGYDFSTASEMFHTRVQWQWVNAELRHSIILFVFSRRSNEHNDLNDPNHLIDLNKL